MYDDHCAVEGAGNNTADRRRVIEPDRPSGTSKLQCLSSPCGTVAAPVVSLTHHTSCTLFLPVRLFRRIFPTRTLSTEDQGAMSEVPEDPDTAALYAADTAAVYAQFTFPNQVRTSCSLVDLVID
jgi:hypothetical protein